MGWLKSPDWKNQGRYSATILAQGLACQAFKKAKRYATFGHDHRFGHPVWLGVSQKIQNSGLQVGSSAEFSVLARTMIMAHPQFPASSCRPPRTNCPAMMECPWKPNATSSRWIC
jgi:hypothetical protein